jgi:ATP-dependent DNA helicase RecQ
MELYQVQMNTILDHLTKYAQEGNSLRHSDGELLSFVSLDAELQASALTAFEKLGADRLRPVFDELGGAVSFDDLKVLRLYFLSTRSTINQKS